MDWVTVILLVVAGASLAGNVVLLNARQASKPLSTKRRAVYAGKWQLPPPGVNLDLYRRTKKLLDELEAERNDARRERNEFKDQRDWALNQCNRLESKLGSAREILRQWERHPRAQSSSERQRIISIL